MNSNPLRYPCPTCGADKGERCTGFDTAPVLVSHTARFPVKPLRDVSDPNTDNFRDTAHSEPGTGSVHGVSNSHGAYDDWDGGQE